MAIGYQLSYLITSKNICFLKIAEKTNCTPPGIEDFPNDIFSDKQRQDGAVILHVIASLYLFVALAIVCDKYFVPAVEKICQGKIYFFI